MEGQSAPPPQAVACGEGLGPKRDPERTRRLILEAAVREFANHGLGGARVSRIAVAAGVNKRMLYHYFGNKDGLYLAALECVYETIRARELALELDSMPPRAAIVALMTTLFDLFVQHPEYISLLNSENLNRARHIAQSSRIRSLQSPLLAMLARLLQRGVDTGAFRPGIDPLQLYLSIASLCYFYLSNRFTLSVIFDRDLMAPDARQARLRHITELVLAFLERRPASESDRASPVASADPADR